MIIAVGLGISQLFIASAGCVIWLKIAALFISLIWPIASQRLVSQTPLVADTSDVIQRKTLSFIQAHCFSGLIRKQWIMIVWRYCDRITRGRYEFLLPSCYHRLFFLVFGTPCTFVWLGFGITALKRYLASPRHL